jgi:putative transposase
MQAVVALKADFPLGLLLRIAKLARSTFYYHQARRDRPDAQADLKAAIVTVFLAVQGRYGHRRIHAKLRTEGWRITKKTV